MTTLIGRRCTHGDVFSRPVLIGRGLGVHSLPVLAMERSGGSRAMRQAPEMSRISGGHSGGVTPVPIPNTEVKTASADGTWGATPWESRSSPGFLDRPRLRDVSVMHRRDGGVFTPLGAPTIGRQWQTTDDAVAPTARAARPRSGV